MGAVVGVNSKCQSACLGSHDVEKNIMLARMTCRLGHALAIAASTLRLRGAACRDMQARTLLPAAVAPCRASGGVTLTLTLNLDLDLDLDLNLTLTLNLNLTLNINLLRPMMWGTDEKSRLLKTCLQDLDAWEQTRRVVCSRRACKT